MPYQKGKKARQGLKQYRPKRRLNEYRLVKPEVKSVRDQYYDITTVGNINMAKVSYNGVSGGVGLSTSTRCCQNFNVIAEGVNQDKRVGNKVTYKEMEIRGSFAWNDDVAGAGAFDTTIGFDQFRIVVALIKMRTPGTEPFATEVFTNMDQSNVMDVMQTELDKSRATILWDKTFTYEHYTRPSDPEDQRMIPFHWKKRVNFTTEYTDITGTISQCLKNVPVLIMVSARGTVLGGYGAKWVCKSRFTDV